MKFKPSNPSKYYYIFPLLTLPILAIAFIFVFFNSHFLSAPKIQPQNPSKPHSFFPPFPKIQVILPKPLPSNPHSSFLIQAYMNRSYHLIKTPKSLNPKIPFSSLFILGMTAFKKKQYLTSIRFLQPLSKIISPVQPWILYHLGISFSLTRQSKKSLQALKQFRTLDPHSPWIFKSLKLESNIYSKTQQIQTLIQEFQTFLLKYPLQNHSQSVKNFLWSSLANAYLSIQDYSNSRSFVQKFISSTQNIRKPKNLKIISSSLNSLIRQNQITLSPPQKILFAQFLLHQFLNPSPRQSQKYRKSLPSKIKKLLNFHPSNPLLNTPHPQLKAQKSLILAQILAQINQPSKAQKLYQIALNQAQNTPLQTQTQYSYFRFLKKINPQKAYSFLQIILPKITQINQYPPHKNLCKNALNLVNPSLQYDTIRFLLSCFSQKQFQPINHFLISLFSQKKYQLLISLFSQIIPHIPNHPLKSKILFWIGKTHSLLKNTSSAQKSFQTALNSKTHDFYFFQNLKNIQTPQNITPKYPKYPPYPPNLKSSVQSIYTNYNFQREPSTRFLQAYYLISLGQIPQGYRLFLQYLKTLSHPHNYYLVFSKMFYQLKLYHLSIRYADFLNQYLNQNSTQYAIFPQLQKIQYPLYFKKLIFSQALKHNINPFLIMALIREESRFFPHATSKSNAMGLMQLIPTTAKFLLHQSPLKSQFTQFPFAFYHQNINVPLGTQYLASLLRKKPTYLALASYNAGPTRINKLYKKLSQKIQPLIPEHFIELIRIDETRNYVKKVLKSYYQYQKIYQ